MKIFKYSILDNVPTYLPQGYIELVYQIQNDTLCLWALVDPMQEMVPVKFKILGTGFEVPKGYIYKTTIQDGQYVWHLFIEP